MKNKLCILLILFVPLISYGQTIQKLIDKKGFQDLKIGSLINNYSGFVKLTSINNADEFQQLMGCQLAYKGGKYTHIGDAKIKYLGVELYEDKGLRIASIHIFCEYDAELITNTIAMFGEPQSSWNMESESGKVILGFMTWNTPDIFLNLNSKKYKSDNDSQLSTIPNNISLVYGSQKIADIQRKQGKEYKKRELNRQFNKVKDDY